LPRPTLFPYTTLFRSSMLAQAFSFILISKLNPTFDPRLLTGYMLVLGSVVILSVSLVVEGNVAQLSKLFSWKLGSIFMFSAVVRSEEHTSELQSRFDL